MEGDHVSGSPREKDESTSEQTMDTDASLNLTQVQNEAAAVTATVSGKRKRDSDNGEDERSVRKRTNDANPAVEEPVSTTSAGDAAGNPATANGSNAAPNSGTTSSSAASTAAADGTSADGTKPAQAATTASNDADAAGLAAGGFQLDRESLVFAAECHMAVLQDEDGDTPLHLAVVQANKHLVHHLVYLISRSSRHVDIANALRQTPLHLAAITGQADLIRLLLANNASVNMPDRLGRTGLHLAAERNYVDCAGALLEARSVALEVRNFEGYAPVHTAVFNNSYGVLRSLLAAGASASPHDGKSGRTPLHHAAEAGNGAMVQFLIGSYADIDATTYAGNTALHSAAGRGHEHIVSVLVTAGADTRLQNTEGDVAADVARFRNAFRAPVSAVAVTTASATQPTVAV